jgi:hypothetical protein
MMQCHRQNLIFFARYCGAITDLDRSLPFPPLHSSCRNHWTCVCRAVLGCAVDRRVPHCLLASLPAPTPCRAVPVPGPAPASVALWCGVLCCGVVWRGVPSVDVCRTDCSPCGAGVFAQLLECWWSSWHTLPTPP